MNLDDFAAFARLDPQNMLAQIDGLPDQLQAAWELGQAQELPAWSGIRQVLIAGMGGSAIGGDLLAAYAEPLCRVPVIVQRDYSLPAWAQGSETLVVASSHSGNTEETLSSYNEALKRGCRVLAVTTGGLLAQFAARDSLPAWIFEHKGQPRAAVGFSFGLLLALLVRLGLLEDATNAVRQATEVMRRQQGDLRAEQPAARNPAKRLAGQLMGRWVAVIGAGVLSPVARRWKGQISEVAKAWAQFEFLPEADHNTLAGTQNPEEVLSRMMVLFLRAPSYHARNWLRSNLTRQILMVEGLNTDFIDAQGETPLAQLWSALHFGDYVAYYLAMAYGVDPTPVEALENLKVELSRAG